MVKVKNCVDTSNLVCSCPESNSWLEHWERKADRKAKRCSSCSAPVEVGAHVQRVDDDKTIFIVPLCKACNKIEGVFWVYESDLVEAACEKSTP